VLHRGAGTHFGGLRVLQAPGGARHVFFGTRTFMRDPSMGEFILDYLKLGSDGSVQRTERLPAGGYGFSLADASQDGEGTAYALVRGAASGGRYPAHVVQVAPGAVTSSVVANYEIAVSMRVLAVGAVGALPVAATQSCQPVRVRTLTVTVHGFPQAPAPGGVDNRIRNGSYLGRGAGRSQGQAHRRARGEGRRTGEGAG
jgi:hypothetical protein